MSSTRGGSAAAAGGDEERKYPSSASSSAAASAMASPRNAASSPLPVVYPSARGAGPTNPALRLNIPATPAQQGVVRSVPASAIASPSNVSSSQQQQHLQQQHQLALLTSPISSPSGVPPGRTTQQIVAQHTRVPMPTPGSRRSGALGTRGSGGGGKPPKAPSSLDRFAACFRAPQSESTIFDIPLSTLYAPYARLPPFLSLSLDTLEHSLSQGLVRAEQLFAESGPDAVPESRLQDLVNFLEEANESDTARLSVHSIGFYGPPAVAAFLHRFLACMPEPLCTLERYNQFLTAANMNPEVRGKGANTLFRATFPFVNQQQGRAGAGLDRYEEEEGPDEHDQLLVMQSLILSLPGAHYLLLQRMLLLFQRMLDADAAMSPRGPRGGGMNPLSPSGGGGVSSSTSVSLQRLSLLFCSTFLEAPPPLQGASSSGSSSSSASKSSAAALKNVRALDSSLRRAQEQQVLIYMVQHYPELFEHQWVREAHQVPAPAPLLPGPDPALHEVEVSRWRAVASKLKLNFSRRHFDDQTRAEAYRQLALLKQDLLAEKHKNALLTRELYGLKEEFELRDFADQLRQQVGAVTSGAGFGLPAGIGGAAYRPPPAASSTSAPAGSFGASPSRPYVVGGSALKQPNGSASDVDEKEQAASALLVQGLERTGGRYNTRAGALAPRDISADLAAVRALQEQDRALTNSYSRINPLG